MALLGNEVRHFVIASTPFVLEGSDPSSAATLAR
jgi:hypothetical protein